jgi:hypothetical protein
MARPGECKTVDVSASDFVFEHGLASDLLQRGKLHGRILVFGANAGVAVLHAPIIGLTFRIRKPLFSGSIFRVQKLTLCWTPRLDWRIRCPHQKSSAGSTVGARYISVDFCKTYSFF